MNFILVLSSVCFAHPGINVRRKNSHNSILRDYKIESSQKFNDVRVKWGVSSRWLTSLYCSMWDSGQTAIGKTHTILGDTCLFLWNRFLLTRHKFSRNQTHHNYDWFFLKFHKNCDSFYIVHEFQEFYQLFSPSTVMQSILTILLECRVFSASDHY